MSQTILASLLALAEDTNVCDPLAIVVPPWMAADQQTRPLLPQGCLVMDRIGEPGIPIEQWELQHKGPA